MEVTRTFGSSPTGTGEGRKESQEQQDGAGASGDAPGEERAGAFSISGLPAEMLTLEVRHALESLVAEIERLRHELELAEGREAYLKDRVDTHPFLPVLNRGAFIRELGKALASAEHLQTPTGLLCLDVVNGDDLRRRHGRQVLDQALAHVCAIIAGELHPTDIFGSLGGNDFGVILLVGDAATTAGKGQSLIEAVNSRPFRWQQENIHLEVVTGIHILEAGASPEVVLAEADRDLMARGKESLLRQAVKR